MHSGPLAEVGRSCRKWAAQLKTKLNCKSAHENITTNNRATSPKGTTKNSVKRIESKKAQKMTKERVKLKMLLATNLRRAGRKRVRAWQELLGFGFALILLLIAAACCLIGQLAETTSAAIERGQHEQIAQQQQATSAEVAAKQARPLQHEQIVFAKTGQSSRASAGQSSPSRRLPASVVAERAADPMEACYLAHNRASETLTISESTPVGTIVGEIMVSFGLLYFSHSSFIFLCVCV